MLHCRRVHDPEPIFLQRIINEFITKVDKTSLWCFAAFVDCLHLFCRSAKLHVEQSEQFSVVGSNLYVEQHHPLNGAVEKAFPFFFAEAEKIDNKSKHMDEG